MSGAVWIEADTPFATSVSGLLTPILLAVVIAILGWTARTLLSLSQIVALMKHEVTPDNGPSLTQQVGALREDLAVLKDRGRRSADEPVHRTEIDSG